MARIKFKVLNRPKAIGVRFTDVEYAELRQAANHRELRVTQFIRERAVAGARTLLDGIRKKQSTQAQ